MTLTKRLFAGILLLLAICATSAPAIAQQGISQKVAVCDPAYPTRCIKPLADGSLPAAGSSFTNITTNASTNVKASPGTLAGLVVNTAGVTSAVAIYNDADGTCNTGLIGTYSTLAQASIPINATASVGICATTTGGTPANITILWR